MIEAQVEAHLSLYMSLLSGSIRRTMSTTKSKRIETSLSRWIFT